jgi:hypothetical protein
MSLIEYIPITTRFVSLPAISIQAEEKNKKDRQEGHTREPGVTEAEQEALVFAISQGDAYAVALSKMLDVPAKTNRSYT